MHGFVVVLPPLHVRAVERLTGKSKAVSLTVYEDGA